MTCLCYIGDGMPVHFPVLMLPPVPIRKDLPSIAVGCCISVANNEKREQPRRIQNNWGVLMVKNNLLFAHIKHKATAVL